MLCPPDINIVLRERLATRETILFLLLLLTDGKSGQSFARERPLNQISGIRSILETPCPKLSVQMIRHKTSSLRSSDQYTETPLGVQVWRGAIGQLDTGGFRVLVKLHLNEEYRDRSDDKMKYEPKNRIVILLHVYGKVFHVSVKEIDVHNRHDDEPRGGNLSAHAVDLFFRLHRPIDKIDAESKKREDDDYPRIAVLDGHVQSCVEIIPRGTLRYKTKRAHSKRSALPRNLRREN